MKCRGIEMNVLMCEYLDVNTVFQVGSHYYAKNFQHDGYKVNWINQPKPYVIQKNRFVEVENKGFKVFNPRVVMPFCKLPLFNTKLWANNYINKFSNELVSHLDGEQIDILW